MHVVEVWAVDGVGSLPVHESTDETRHKAYHDTSAYSRPTQLNHNNTNNNYSNVNNNTVTGDVNHLI